LGDDAMNAKFLSGYSGQTVDQLLSLYPEYRIDSIVLAFEEALGRKVHDRELHGLNEVEITVLAVEALEREVNNGGHHQFFLNTPEYAEHIVAALRRIGCIRMAEVAQRAIDLLQLPGPVTTSRVEDAIQQDSTGKLIEILSDECDATYFDEPEAIADRLFAYVSENRERIRLQAT
jgi:hypothetical protein